MTASNPAVGAWPGWRGTDQKGGTWWRVGGHLAETYQPWLSTGEEVADDLLWRTQEEAEAAGLVPLVADDPDAQLACAIGLCMEPARGRDAEGFSVCVDHLPAAPAPLDPGNPKHLRQVADVLDSVGRLETARWIRSEADRLDRERAEAEQDADDLKLAERIARDAHERERGLTGTPTWGAITQASRRSQIEAALAGIRAADERAERAEREESGNVCCCGAMRIPADQLSVTVTDTVHRHGGPCYVAGEGEE